MQKNTIALIANHPNDRRESMDRYVDMLSRELKGRNWAVEVLRPRQFWPWLAKKHAALGKWLAYVDKFFRFPRFLRHHLQALKQRGQPIVVHICDHSDAVYVPSLAGYPHMVTCHDMIAVRSALGELPMQLTRFTGRIYQRLIMRGLRQAAAIVCVSDTTRLEFERIAGPGHRKVAVIKNPLNYPYAPMSLEMAAPLLERSFQRQGKTRTERYLFHVGGNQWYKNRLGLIRIYHALSQKGDVPPLVMAGKPLSAEAIALISQLGLVSRVCFVGNVTNDELNALYSQADALLFPSLMEGFGWPVIEAQAVGCPVIASDIPIFHEVGGNSVCYINAEDPDAAGAQIFTWFTGLKNAGARLACINQGVENAALFSVENIMDSYLELYAALK